MDYQSYPSLPIRPLNFDATSDEENDENDVPTVISNEEVTILSHQSEKILLNESTEESSMDISSSSSMIRYRKINSSHVGYSHYTPAATQKIVRKRKYCENVSFSSTTISHMPNEVLNEVFSYLNKRDLLHVGATCKRFYDVTSTQSHWTDLNLSGKRVLETSLQRMVSRKAKSLCMTNTVVYTEPKLTSRIFAPCSLTRLDLSWARCPGSDLVVLKGLLGRCQKLEYLGLESLTIDAELLEMVAKNPELLVLNLSSCQVIDAKALSHVFAACNKIKDLNMSWTCPDVPTGAVIVNEIPSTVERLGLAGMNDNAAFNDEGLITLLKRVPNLIELDVGDNLIVTSLFMMELANVASLKKLTASRCYGVEPLTFTLFKNIKEMNLHGCLSNVGYEFMKEELPTVAFNSSPFTSIGRSLEGNLGIFWGVDISELY